VNYFKSLADIETAKEALKTAQLNLEFTKVKASVDGWISNINFQIGSQATANRALLALVDKESFWVFGGSHLVMAILEQIFFPLSSPFFSGYALLSVSPFE